MSAAAAVAAAAAAATPAAAAGARNPWSHRKPLSSRNSAFDSLREFLESTGVGAEVRPEHGERQSLLLAQDASRTIELVADLNKVARMLLQSLLS